MAINRKLIHFKNKENFDTEVANGNILDRSIVFIQDSKEISTHGTVYRSINWSVLQNPWDELENGVYAVSADGKPVTYENADETCIAVALIVNDAPIPQKLMIEKYGEGNTTSIKSAYTADGATDTGYKYFYWGSYDTEVDGITNYTATGGGGTSTKGFLPRADGTYYSTPNLSSDYTTWTTGALSDFNGKSNTAELLKVTDSDSYTKYANMGTYVSKFNGLSPDENQGKSDWYIPALGQLALIYLNRTDINSVLTKIGGVTLIDDAYWSSSERSSTYGWYIGNTTAGVVSYQKYGYCLVRFVRDL